jgi:hypothetical protein
MFRLCKPLFTAGLLVVLLAPLTEAQAGDCGNSSCSSCSSCGGCGGGSLKAWFHEHYVPDVTFYAALPYWFPNYFGPPYTSYQQCQYWTPPAESARIVAERIKTINAANPALLPPAEPLPLPKVDKKIPLNKLP